MLSEVALPGKLILKAYSIENTYILCRHGSFHIAITLLISFCGLQGLALAQSNPGLFPHKRIYTAVRVDGKEDATGQIKIQSGFKVEVRDNSGLFIAYSIKSLLDVQEKSEPFRDINHNPEIFFEIKSDVIPFMHKTSEYIRVGYEHESNGVNNSSVGPEGRDGRSRTTHNANIQPYFELRDHLWFSPKLWWHFQKIGNQDIEEFYGNVDLTLEYKRGLTYSQPN